jgi:hypothetical protein
MPSAYWCAIKGVMSFSSPFEGHELSVVCPLFEVSGGVLDVVLLAELVPALVVVIALTGAGGALVAAPVSYSSSSIW